jgi:hypothetical protein
LRALLARRAAVSASGLAGQIDGWRVPEESRDGWWAGLPFDSNFERFAGLRWALLK